MHTYCLLLYTNIILHSMWWEYMESTILRGFPQLPGMAWSLLGHGMGVLAVIFAWHCCCCCCCCIFWCCCSLCIFLLLTSLCCCCCHSVTCIPPRMAWFLLGNGMGLLAVGWLLFLLLLCFGVVVALEKLIGKELRNSTPVSNFLFGCLNKHKKCNYYRKNRTTICKQCRSLTKV